MDGSAGSLLLAGVLVAGVTAGCDHGTTNRADHDAIARAIGQTVAIDETAMFVEATDLARGQAPAHPSLAFEISCTDDSGNQLLLCSERSDRADASFDDGEHRGEWSVTGVQNPAIRFDGSGKVSTELDVDDRHYLLETQVRYDRIHVSPTARQLVGGFATYYATIHRTGGDGDVQLDLELLVKIGDDGTAILALDGEEAYTLALASGAISPR